MPSSARPRSPAGWIGLSSATSLRTSGALRLDSIDNGDGTTTWSTSVLQEQRRLATMACNVPLACQGARRLVADENYQALKSYTVETRPTTVLQIKYEKAVGEGSRWASATRFRLDPAKRRGPIRRPGQAKASTYSRAGTFRERLQLSAIRSHGQDLTYSPPTPKGDTASKRGTCTRWTCTPATSVGQLCSQRQYKWAPTRAAPANGVPAGPQREFYIDSTPAFSPDVLSGLLCLPMGACTPWSGRRVSRWPDCDTSTRSSTPASSWRRADRRPRRRPHHRHHLRRHLAAEGRQRQRPPRMTGSSILSAHRHDPVDLYHLGPGRLIARRSVGRPTRNRLVHRGRDQYLYKLTNTAR